MKKKMRNVLVMASIMTAIGVTAANAGTLVTADTTFATEDFGSALTPAAAVIKPGAMTYSTSSATTVNAGGTVYFNIRLANAKFAAAPAVTTFKIGSVVCAAVPGAAGSGTQGAVVTISPDKTTIQVAITANPDGMSLGLGAFTYTPGAADIDSANALATAGTSVTSTVSLTTIATVAADLDSTNALPASADGVAPSASLAHSANAIVGVVSALPTYTNKIDLTASPVASNYTTPGQMALGSVTYTTTAGRKILTGAADYTLESDSTAAALTATISVTPGANQSFPIGSILSYDVTSSACGATAGALPAITAATASTAKTLTIPAVDLTTAVPIYVCMSAPSATNTAAPITAALVGTTVAAAVDKVDTATGNGYPVQYNGATKDVRNYIPAAVGAGFTQIIRVINTGSVAADISVAKVSEATGAVGTAGVVAAALPAGATVRLTQAQIEAVIGTVAATERPRLRFTGPTNSIDVQSLMYSNGVYTDITGAQ